MYHLLSRWRELNSRPLPYQGSALPLSYTGGHSFWSGRRGSNPRPLAWKANALPTELLPQLFPSGRGWIRTTEGIASRFTVCPIWPLWYSPKCKRTSFEPMEGVEPTTPRLQITCSGQLSYIGSCFSPHKPQKGLQRYK